MTRFENYKRPCCISFHIKTRRWLRNLIQYGPQTGLLAVLVTILIIWLGALAQDTRTAASKDTKYLYETTRVCGLQIYNATTTTSISSATFMLSAETSPSSLLNNVSTMAPSSSAPDQQQLLPQEDDNDDASSSSVPLITIETFDSKDALLVRQHEAHNETSLSATSGTSVVAHCGDCGACSNPHDIQIYDQTKDTLFENSLVCSKRGLFGGRRVARRCLRERVGFTDECNECWVENIMCDVRHCLFTCMWHALFNEVNSNDPQNLDHQQALNRCTECDEKRCGPAFVKCAGANRRRSGILSEFERDVENEFCTAVDTGWWNDERLQSYWDRQKVRDKDQLEDEDKNNSRNGEERRSLRLGMGMSEE